MNSTVARTPFRFLQFRLRLVNDELYNLLLTLFDGQLKSRKIFKDALVDINSVMVDEQSNSSKISFHHSVVKEARCLWSQFIQLIVNAHNNAFHPRRRQGFVAVSDNEPLPDLLFVKKDVVTLWIRCRNTRNTTDFSFQLNDNRITSLIQYLSL